MKIDKNLLKGSLVLLVAFNLFNLINFFFQFGMARLLPLAEFGVLSALFAIIYILTIFAESIQLVISKYSTDNKDSGAVKNLMKRSLRKSLKISSILFIIYVFISIPLSNLLRIDYYLLIFNGLMIFGTFLIPITRGILQGKKKFNSLGFNMVLEAVIKLVLAIVLVWMGWMVWGAMVATVLGLFIAFGLSFINIGDIIKSKEKTAKTDQIYSYSKPSFVLMFTILVFYSLDLLIAKMFFAPDVAGAYAIASILAKIIFLGTQPISRAMFPLSMEKGLKKSKSENVFKNSLLLLSLLILISLAVFFFFPGFVIELFSGKVLPDAAGIIFYLAISMGFLSLTNLVLLYKLSLGKTRRYPLLLVFILLEIFLLVYFSNSLLQFSVAFIAASAAFLWGSIVLIGD